MGVSKETDGIELVAEVSLGRLIPEDIAPPVWIAQRTVDEGEVFHVKNQRDLAQVFTIEGGELLARPVNAFPGPGRKQLHGFVAAGIIVVVALDHLAFEAADHLKTDLWIGIISHYVARAGKVGYTLSLGIIKHGLESLQVGVNIT